MAASTDAVDKSAPMTADPEKALKRPRTFDIPRWRTVKPTSLCIGSIAQVPAVRVGDSVVVMSDSSDVSSLNFLSLQYLVQD